MNYIEIIIIILLTFIITICSLISYFKGIRKSQFSLLITMCFYGVFIVTSIFVDSSFLLPFMKEKLNITIDNYDSVITFISNIILKISLNLVRKIMNI